MFFHFFLRCFIYSEKLRKNIEVTVFVTNTLLRAIQVLQRLFDISVALILHQIVSHSVMVLYWTLWFSPFPSWISTKFYGVSFRETCRQLFLKLTCYKAGIHIPHKFCLWIIFINVIRRDITWELNKYRVLCHLRNCILYGGTEYF
jgi:hypothetical protein